MELRGWELIVVLSILVLVVYHLCPRVTRPLAERKAWRRTFFVLGLGMDGRIADALWRTDPWLAGPGNSTANDMLRFAHDFVQLCNTDWNLHWKKSHLQTDPNYCGYLCKAEFGRIDLECNGQYLSITFAEKYLHYTQFLWNKNGRFDCQGSHSFTGQRYSEVVPNFAAFRAKLLDCAQFFVNHKRIK